MVKAKFNWYAYLSFFFVLLFLSASVYFLANPQLVLKSKSGSVSSPTFVGIVFLIITILVFYLYARIIYLVRVETNTIKISGILKRKQISLEEIKSINLFSKENFYWSAGVTTLAIRIELNNGQGWIIADPFYKNVDLIKSAINENFKEKIEPFQTEKKLEKRQEKFEYAFEKFAGNPFTSFNLILLIGISVAIIGIVFKKKTVLLPTDIFMLIPLLAFYLGFGYQLNYFLISNKRLRIRNHILPWVKKEFNISNIIIANFEHPYRRSQALRITTSDFKSKIFYAGSLRDKHWIQLKEKLEAEGIIIV